MSWRDRNPDERADDIAEAGSVCLDCACVFDASHSARLCPTHAAAPRMLEFITSIVHGNAAERIDEASPSLARLARALLREIHGDQP